ncbi:glycosyltransferase 25 family member [Drosophila bipectinata]|uniref:glycosyltransferase 25 family member n=1 Tax=Drosophila bipectinata TaxID=42026 RepID=UPI001C893EA4|nr:glycosyltransferase 25 family member [Drosophila bipectinata]
MNKQVLFSLFLASALVCILGNDAEDDREPPTILVALLVRNKAHTLPMFLSYLDQQEYPKQRIAFWLRSDHNADDSVNLLQKWLKHSAESYHSVNFSFETDEQSYPNESSPYEWSSSRFKNLISLKEEAFGYARDIWADYVFFLDADVMLTSKDALTRLTQLRLPIVAPMLLSESLYSNYWCGMTEEYYYQRTDEYKEIYHLKKVGSFPVPMVHTAVLVDMNYKGVKNLTFDKSKLQEMQKTRNQEPLFDGPSDDIIVFAISANSSGIPMHVCNEITFGYILQPLEPGDSLDQDLQQLVHIRASMITDLGDVPPFHDYFQHLVTKPEKSKLTLDHIFMINLERRPERRQKMEKLFDEIGLDVEHFPAVDGKELNIGVVKQMGITFMPGYEDPYHHRAMTMGEIGCFLSHYRIWVKMVQQKLKEVLILEDDIRFEPYFRNNAVRVLNQARSVVEYDLIYFGRKRLKEESEPWVADTDSLVHAGYSYWTLGYVLSYEGALKLLAAKPLEKLIPVDEFLPVMFDRHPNKTWSQAYKKRDLVAFSAAPLLLYPVYYTGDFGYISDTEDSQQINVEANEGEARLKSDREQVFLKEDENSSDQQLKLGESKSHQEL